MLELTLRGGARHDLVSVVLCRVAFPAIDALVARNIVVVKLSCNAREAHGGRRACEAGGPAAAREMGRPAVRTWDARGGRVVGRRVHPVRVGRVIVVCGKRKRRSRTSAVCVAILRAQRNFKKIKRASIYRKMQDMMTERTEPLMRTGTALCCAAIHKRASIVCRYVAITTIVAIRAARDAVVQAGNAVFTRIGMRHSVVGVPLAVAARVAVRAARVAVVPALAAVLARIGMRHSVVGVPLAVSARVAVRAARVAVVASFAAVLALAGMRARRICMPLAVAARVAVRAAGRIRVEPFSARVAVRAAGRRVVPPARAVLARALGIAVRLCVVFALAARGTRILAALGLVPVMNLQRNMRE